MDLPQKHVEVRSSRLLLRPLRLDDAPGVFTMRSDPIAVKYTSTLPETSITQTQETIQKWMDMGRYNFAVELLNDDEVGVSNEGKQRASKRKFVGCVGIVRAAEIGYCFARESWGKGYASEALRAFLPIAWEHLSQPGGSDYVRAGIDVENAGSIRLVERLGFKYDGKVEGEYFSPTLKGSRDCVFYRLNRPDSCDSSAAVVVGGGPA